jgi:peptidoglycan/LPS O-acetylase OafA/YrhL
VNKIVSDYGQPRNLGLDLLRATAIVLVMCSHWSNNILYWFGIHTNPQVYFIGVLGVALFFALSGFLIGRILLREAARDASWINFGIFLVRRWMRTLPLYFVVLAILLIAVPTQYGTRLEYAAMFATMTQNLWHEMPADYWFSVSWSLTIEEWFYVFFGIAVFGSFMVFRDKARTWVPIVAFISIPLLVRIFVPGMATHQIALIRLDEIAYGVVMAVMYERRSRIFDYPKTCLAIGLLFMLSAWTGRIPAPVGLRDAFAYSTQMIGCALMLPAALRLKSLPRTAEWAVRRLSIQSYGLYLMHEIILVDFAQELWGRHGVPAWICVLIALILPFVLSYLSHRFFESPILRMRPKHQSMPQPRVQVSEYAER